MRACMHAKEKKYRPDIKTSLKQNTILTDSYLNIPATQRSEAGTSPLQSIGTSTVLQEFTYNLDLHQKQAMRCYSPKEKVFM